MCVYTYINIDHAVLNGDGIAFYDIAGISTASCLLWKQGFTGGSGDMMDDETRNTGDDVSYGWNHQEIVLHLDP